MGEGEARYDDLEDMVAAYEPVAQVRYWSIVLGLFGSVEDWMRVVDR